MRGDPPVATGAWVNDKARGGTVDVCEASAGRGVIRWLVVALRGDEAALCGLFR